MQTPSFRTVIIGILGAFVAVGLVGGSLVLGERHQAEAAQIRADALAFEQEAEQQQAARARAAEEEAAQEEADRVRDAERQARRQRIADQRAAAEQAARDKAAEEQAAQERAARKAARQAAAQEAAEEKEAAEQAAKEEKAAAAVRHVIAGEMTVPDINGALAAHVGGYPGQPLDELGMNALNKLERMLDSLEQGKTYPCPGGSGGGLGDVVAGGVVKIQDGEGKVLATSALEGGLINMRGCTFTFSAKVPDADFYQVTITDRGALTFSRSDLEKSGWKVLARL